MAQSYSVSSQTSDWFDRACISQSGKTQISWIVENVGVFCSAREQNNIVCLGQQPQCFRINKSVVAVLKTSLVADCVMMQRSAVMLSGKLVPRRLVQLARLVVEVRHL